VEDLATSTFGAEMDAEGTSETIARTYKTRRRHLAASSTFSIYNREGLKSVN